MKRISRFFSFFLLGFLSISFYQCRATMPESGQLKIDKGIEILAGDPDPFPFVVAINNGSCSGSFIGPNVLITAAHCVRNKEIDYNGHKAIKIRYSSNFGNPQAEQGSQEHDAWVYKHDIAFGIFGSDVAPAVVRLSHRVPQPGDVIAIVGYGCFSAKKYYDNLRKLEKGLKLSEEDLAIEGAGTKRYGFNFIQTQKIPMFSTQTMLTFRTHGQPIAELTTLGRDVGACPGDSGGPMLFNNELIGVSSFITSLDNEVFETFDSYYANIRDNLNWQDIQRVLEMGKVAGYKGSRPIWPRQLPPKSSSESDEDLLSLLPEGMAPPRVEQFIYTPPQNFIIDDSSIESARKLMQDAIALAMTRIKNCAIVDANLVGRLPDDQGTFDFQARAVFLDGSLSAPARFTTSYTVQNARSLAVRILNRMFKAPLEERVFQHLSGPANASQNCQIK